MIRNLIQKFVKPLSLDYVTKYLRNKGIATHASGENGLRFKLYDMNWDVYCEEGRFGLRSSFNLGDDINMDCMYKAVNKLNEERWIVKSFIETYSSNEDCTDKTEETNTSIVFSFEGFCYSERDFDKIYEFAIYAMTDGIEFHRKIYAETVKEFNLNKTKPIGYNSEHETNEKLVSAVDNKQRRRIGFHSYNDKD